MKKEKVLVIVGPTAVGKTSLGIQLAKKFNGEIISGDSLQVYKGLDIGTAKVMPEEQCEVPHYLIDIKEATDTYSAHDFKKEAESKIIYISNQNKLPIIVGGTGLYIQSLLFDFQMGKKVNEDETLDRRAYWEDFAQKNGKEKLWIYLKEIDPLSASAIHMNNQKRILRAIEVYEATGKSITNQQTYDFSNLDNSQYDVKLIGLETERAFLYQLINQRVDCMVANGLIEEAKFVFDLNDVQASQGIGYKEFFPFFNGEKDLDSCIETVKQHSRRYAKRQLTWFRNRMPVEWFDIITHKEQRVIIEKEIKEWLTN